MKIQLLILAAMMCLSSAIADAYRAQMPTSNAVPSSQPTTRPEKEGPVSVRQIEITLLGKVSDIKGMPPWPENTKLWRSWSVEEPCELTLHLPPGKVLKIRTRPILIVSRDGDTVVEVHVPPIDAGSARMSEQAALMDKLLAEWDAAPNKRMREAIELYKRGGPPSAADIEMPSAGFERIGGAWLDEKTQLLFELFGSKSEMGHGCGVQWDFRPVRQSRLDRSPERLSPVRRAYRPPSFSPVDLP